MKDSTIKKWKRDALEMKFNLQNGKEDTMSSSYVSILCSRVATLSHMLEIERYRTSTFSKSKLIS